MNERLPDSAGLPLRAMVMVLLFLGVIFLLVGFQTMSSSGSSDDSTSTSVTATASAPPSGSATTAAAPRPDVRVYNISEQDNLAAQTADKLKKDDWNVTETGNLKLDWLDVTTVFYDPDTPGELEAAKAVAKVVGTDRVESRHVDDPDIADQDPGIIVVVAG